MSLRSAADVAVGTELPEQVVRVTRADLVRYAGASGDFNPIHWNDRVATAVGLPGVIAHGMWTMGAASSVVADAPRSICSRDPQTVTRSVYAAAPGTEFDAGGSGSRLRLAGRVSCARRPADE